MLCSSGLNDRLLLNAVDHGEFIIQRILLHLHAQEGVAGSTLLGLRRSLSSSSLGLLGDKLSVRVVIAARTSLALLASLGSDTELR